MYITAKQNWFETLADALRSEDLYDIWEDPRSISYGECIRTQLELKPRKIYTISIYRSINGKYERPIVYFSHTERK